jgi:hypothetical protein
MARTVKLMKIRLPKRPSKPWPELSEPPPTRGIAMSPLARKLTYVVILRITVGLCIALFTLTGPGKLAIRDETLS